MPWRTPRCVYRCQGCLSWLETRITCSPTLQDHQFGSIQWHLLQLDQDADRELLDQTNPRCSLSLLELRLLSVAGFLLLLQSPLSHLACPPLLLLVGQALGELLGAGLLLHLVGVRRLVFASPEHESALHFASPDLSLVFDCQHSELVDGVDALPLSVAGLTVPCETGNRFSKEETFVEALPLFEPRGSQFDRRSCLRMLPRWADWVEDDVLLGSGTSGLRSLSKFCFADGEAVEKASGDRQGGVVTWRPRRATGAHRNCLGPATHVVSIIEIFSHARLIPLRSALQMHTMFRITLGKLFQWETHCNPVKK